MLTGATGTAAVGCGLNDLSTRIARFRHRRTLDWTYARDDPKAFVRRLNDRDAQPDLGQAA